MAVILVRVLVRHGYISFLVSSVHSRTVSSCFSLLIGFEAVTLTISDVNANWARNATEPTVCKEEDRERKKSNMRQRGVYNVFTDQLTLAI